MTQVAQGSGSGTTAIRPLPKLDTPEEQIADLRRRINATRWPGRELVQDDSQGVQLATMQALAKHWGSDYDWRKCEARHGKIDSTSSTSRASSARLV